MNLFTKALAILLAIFSIHIVYANCFPLAEEQLKAALTAQASIDPLCSFSQKAIQKTNELVNSPSQKHHLVSLMNNVFKEVSELYIKYFLVHLNQDELKVLSAILKDTEQLLVLYKKRSEAIARHDSQDVIVQIEKEIKKYCQRTDVYLQVVWRIYKQLPRTTWSKKDHNYMVTLCDEMGQLLTVLEEEISRIPTAIS